MKRSLVYALLTGGFLAFLFACWAIGVAFHAIILGSILSWLGVI